MPESNAGKFCQGKKEKIPAWQKTAAVSFGLLSLFSGSLALTDWEEYNNALKRPARKGHAGLAVTSYLHYQEGADIPERLEREDGEKVVHPNYQAAPHVMERIATGFGEQTGVFLIPRNNFRSLSLTEGHDVTMETILAGVRSQLEIIKDEENPHFFFMLETHGNFRTFSIEEEEGVQREKYRKLFAEVFSIVDEMQIPNLKLSFYLDTCHSNSALLSLFDQLVSDDGQYSNGYDGLKYRHPVNLLTASLASDASYMNGLWADLPEAAYGTPFSRWLATWGDSRVDQLPFEDPSYFRNLCRTPPDPNAKENLEIRNAFSTYQSYASAQHEYQTEYLRRRALFHDLKNIPKQKSREKDSGEQISFGAMIGLREQISEGFMPDDIEKQFRAYVSLRHEFLNFGSPNSHVSSVPFFEHEIDAVLEGLEYLPEGKMPVSVLRELLDGSESLTEVQAERAWNLLVKDLSLPDLSETLKRLLWISDMPQSWPVESLLSAVNSAPSWEARHVPLSLIAPFAFHPKVNDFMDLKYDELFQSALKENTDSSVFDVLTQLNKYKNFDEKNHWVQLEEKLMNSAPLAWKSYLLNWMIQERGIDWMTEGQRSHLFLEGIAQLESTYGLILVRALNEASELSNAERKKLAKMILLSDDLRVVTHVLTILNNDANRSWLDDFQFENSELLARFSGENADPVFNNFKVQLEAWRERREKLANES